jgi:uncharacterized membrane protein
MMNTRSYQVAIFVLICVPGSLAHAYVGPGAGLSAIGSVLAFIGACLLVIVGFIWYPVKRMLKRKKTPAAEQETAAENETAVSESAEEKEP